MLNAKNQQPDRGRQGAALPACPRFRGIGGAAPDDSAAETAPGTRHPCTLICGNWEPPCGVGEALPAHRPRCHCARQLHASLPAHQRLQCAVAHGNCTLPPDAAGTPAAPENARRPRVGGPPLGGGRTGRRAAGPLARSARHGAGRGGRTSAAAPHAQSALIEKKRPHHSSQRTAASAPGRPRRPVQARQSAGPRWAAHFA